MDDELSLLDLVAEARSVRRPLGALPAITRDALRTVRRSAGRLLMIALGTQAALAALAVIQVLAAESALQALVNTDAGRQTASAALGPFAVLATATVASALLTVLDQQVQRLLSERVERASWDRLLDVSSAVALETYESPAFYDQMRRIEANTLIRPYTIAVGLVGLVGGALGTVAVGAVLVQVQPLLLPVLALTAIPLAYLARLTGRMEFRFALDTSAMVRERRYFREVLIGRSEAKELRSFDALPVIRQRYDALYDRYLDELRAQVRRRSVLGLLGGGATALATAASFTVLFALVASGRTSLAAAGAALVAVRVLAGRLAQLSNSAASLLESSLFLDDLHAFELRRPPDAVDLRSAAPRLDDIVVEHVSFRYPETTRDALTDVTVRVGIGEVVALVGENGSGKTTLSKIVAQLYEPSDGRLTWNGTEAMMFTPASRRRQVSVTFQDFVRFALPVEDNISLGRGQLRAEARDVTTAARLAGADDFVRALPDGYATVLGKEFAGGLDLSMGQWQRLALARAFYRDARLVVLDEPTASLDARAEHALYEVVRSLFVDRAVLLITHRLASVRNADRIYVLDNGSIAEEGDHQTLLGSGGLYAELYALQASGFVEGRARP